ncbi:hypothetical protein [Spirosoma sp. 209]|uniref:hypothetical protein n=1 Tax=Spirosoma sp. 209 TaxID=1955701 RepID=UPI00098CF23C|nr:hypothetical protein [Spirosoma sp. 209]
MNTPNYTKSAWLTLGLVLAFVAGWELYWRNQHLPIGYNDDESMWASKRRQVYESSPTRPVLIGSSRIKFDLDQGSWARITGEKPIQLSMDGTSPRPVLTDLGNDPNFKGTLIIDVTEMLFFSPDGSFPEKEAIKRVKAYPTWSLSQQTSFQINRLLESGLLFLDDRNLALGPLLNLLPLPARPGTWGGPQFPREFFVVDQDRQSIMTPAFVADTALQNKVKGVWLDVGAHSPPNAVTGPALQAILDATKRSVEQIRARGGQVLFLRTPSDGIMRAAENKLYPREQYWDRLLAYTQTPGIYFEDYPALTRFSCPEWSHLTPADAVQFTEDLIPIVARKTGWPLGEPLSALLGQPIPTCR